MVEIVKFLQKENKDCMGFIKEQNTWIAILEKNPTNTSTNTTLDSIPLYLEKLEDTVNRGAEDEGGESSKDNVRNVRPKPVDRTEHHTS